jgi:5-methylcytosine-specific restriction endonuclease McrA
VLVSSQFDTVPQVLQGPTKTLCDRPAFLHESFRWLDRALRTAKRGDIHGALEELELTRHIEIRQWFVETAQVAGIQRFRELGSRPAFTPEIPMQMRASSKVSPQLGRDVLLRDKYHCRYCGIPVFAYSEAKKIRSLLGAAEFVVDKSNEHAHGTLRAFYNSFDHVIPVSRGGHTSLENLVTACYPCNFGKDNYTLDQLNLQSPFSSPPIESEHDGFVSLLAD